MKQVMTSLIERITGLELCKLGDMVELSASLRGWSETWSGPAIYLGIEFGFEDRYCTASFLCDCNWWNADVLINRVLASLEVVDVDAARPIDVLER